MRVGECERGQKYLSEGYYSTPDACDWSTVNLDYGFQSPRIYPERAQ